MAGGKIIILIYSYIEIIKTIDLNHYMICSINVKHINYNMNERKYTILFNFCMQSKCLFHYEIFRYTFNFQFYFNV